MEGSLIGIDDLDPDSFTDHALVLGAKGSGKTRLGAQIIRAVSAAGRAVIAFDTVGDLTDQVADSSVQRQSLGISSAITMLGAPYGATVETRIDEADALGRALLRLLGYRSRGYTPELALITTVLLHIWELKDLDRLPELIVEPPVQRLGLYDVDVVITRERRIDLAVAVRSVFETTQGVEDLALVSVGDMISEPGSPGLATVISFAELSTQNRRFIVDVLMAKIHAHAAANWTGADLNLLLYFDEGGVFLPGGQRIDPDNPIRRALENWGQFGIGIALVAPELDHLHELAEDMCDLWIVGRTPGPQARQGVVQALDLVNPPVDEAELDRKIKRMGPGEFIVRSPRLNALAHIRTQ